MNTGVPEKSQPAPEFLQLERWHGFVNAATVALFGLPLLNPTTAARAAWLQFSQLVVGFSQCRARKSTREFNPPF
jgi:hypothetical protein